MNDKPHIGHAYTTIAADIMARWNRLCGNEVFFLTGTDEHGEKIEKAAVASKKTPEQFVDGVVLQFVEMWKTLKITNDDFIRTTEQRHQNAVTEFVKRMYSNGDVYKSYYEGWYCTPDETFYTELQLNEGKCPQCGREVKKIKEESYFFKLSKYQDRLLSFYETNPDFLSPSLRKNEIINRVRAGLNDVSITRTSVNWAIRFPIDEKHTIYVWVDALINYLSAIGWPSNDFEHFWPANVHIVGKEINWFHTVIWPAMLFSVGIEPPKKVFAHGWWTVEGKKMSKSLGNAVNPAEVVSKYGLDAFRYFIFREMPFGEDGDFSEKGLIARINGELVDDLGNLVYRTLTLSERTQKIAGIPELDKHLDIEGIKHDMESLNFFAALEKIWVFIRASNKYINENQVWKLSDEKLSNALYNLLESIRIIAILIKPFMPDASQKITEQLGTAEEKISDCIFKEFNGTPKRGSYLFTKIKIT
ncbi:MAG: methionine--tRNA ligase [Candidatus Marsarchaeota archaeon]|nr:methionine--tRNA ligase [Candidatus Marsarchaeota archaeon]